MAEQLRLCPGHRKHFHLWESEDLHKDVNKPCTDNMEGTTSCPTACIWLCCGFVNMHFVTKTSCAQVLSTAVWSMGTGGKFPRLAKIIPLSTIGSVHHSRK